jgi:ABC-type transporter MlaC component
MKKLLFSIIFIMLFSVVLPEAKAENTNTRNAKELIQLLLKKTENTSGSKSNRKKLKKIVRKAGRVYRTVKQDSDSRKKSRKVQRTARRIINIF